MEKSFEQILIQKMEKIVGEKNRIFINIIYKMRNLYKNTIMIDEIKEFSDTYEINYEDGTLSLLKGLNVEYNDLYDEYYIIQEDLEYHINFI